MTLRKLQVVGLISSAFRYHFLALKTGENRGDKALELGAAVSEIFEVCSVVISALLLNFCQKKQENGKCFLLRNLRLPPRHFYPSRGH